MWFISLTWLLARKISKNCSQLRTRFDPSKRAALVGILKAPRDENPTPKHDQRRIGWGQTTSNPFGTGFDKVPSSMCAVTASECRGGSVGSQTVSNIDGLRSAAPIGLRFSTRKCPWSTFRLFRCRMPWGGVISCRAISGTSTTTAGRGGGVLPRGSV